MIQKKSLKDAIQNPEIISVVGGLLPIVSKDSNGLVSRSNYQSFPKNYSINGNKYAKIIQHSTMGAWNVTFIDIFAVRGLGGNPGRIIVAISSDSSSKKNISIVKSGNPDIRVYADSQFIYLKNTYVYGENISITSTTNFPIIFENMSEEPSGLTEIV
jgi:hypothetical protein